MSCNCSCSPCEHTACDAANEPLASALNNFITSFFGSVSKTCINNQVNWVLPCNLDVGNPDFPRQANEGVACYFMRFITTFLAAQQVSIGNKGYRLTTLTNANVTLDRNSDVINQDFTGTLTGPVDIILSSTGATNGDEFFISFDDLVITATNNIEIKSDAISLLVMNSPGTVNGFLKAVYTGTQWKLTLTSTNIS